MKVLFIAQHLKAGGAERQLTYLMKGLLERGIVLSLFIFNPVGEFVDEIPEGVKVYLPKSPLSPKLKRPLRGIWKVKEIIKVIRAEKPDILYSRGWPAKRSTALAGWLLRKKVVLGEGSSLMSHTYTNKNKSISRMDIRNITYRLADVVVAVSQGVADELKQLFKINSKIKLIYNGCDIEETERKGKQETYHPWFNEAEPIAVAVGRLDSQKGFSSLLEAVQVVNRKISLKLIIIGDGHLKENLKKQAEELGIRDKVDFLGVKKNPFAYMSRCDLFILSSLYEGFPNVLVEAMVLGLPVISTNCPNGPNEIIEDGRSGILVPVGDPQAIAGALLRVLGDRQLRHMLGAEARRRARYFSLENMISEYSDLFLSLSGKI